MNFILYGETREMMIRVDLGIDRMAKLEKMRDMRMAKLGKLIETLWRS